MPTKLPTGGKSKRRKRAAARKFKGLGWVVYQGPSKLDGAPIVALLSPGSDNRKTGAMAQLWIMRADIEPHRALKTGDDKSICGACPLSGGAGCYVITHQAPLSAWRAWKRGRYTRLIGAHERATVLGPILANRSIRLGAYGDPAALPAPILEQLVGLSSGHTGYSHQLLTMADNQRANRIARIVMASVETPAQARAVTDRGWRFFGTLPKDNDKAEKVREVYSRLQLPIVNCPAYTRGVKCADCKLCAGADTKARSVVIPAHGITAGSFDRFYQ